ncbi:hypothetical protein JQ760_027965 (plasmid) [Klebsiella pneumoniae]|uniref:hypothetical protein n=1 Tax=Klebsiella pneumoniae TaxID=573 RepID=UPI001FAE23D7|nr:hypothetical protein [Klebsiella pneumoniae]MCI8108504.1 hypothetical protein [Klebsiella pneumoniae]
MYIIPSHQQHCSRSLNVDAVLNRKADAYIERAGLLAAKTGKHIKIDFPEEGEQFALGAYLPVFIGSIMDHE